MRTQGQDGRPHPDGWGEWPPPLWYLLPRLQESGGGAGGGWRLTGASGLRSRASDATCVTLGRARKNCGGKRLLSSGWGRESGVLTRPCSRPGPGRSSRDVTPKPLSVICKTEWS